MKAICVIDTEFNAFDYAGQNDGIQEITEIGAVILQKGVITERFDVICKLYPGHKLTDRCREITGITDTKNGMPFPEAFEAFLSFLDSHHINNIYAYGPDDAIQLRETAKLHKQGTDVFRRIKSIKNIYPAFATKFGLRYQCSLSDICKVCRVPHDLPGRAHQAIYDAEDTALAYVNMIRDNIDGEFLQELKEHKKNVVIYENHRNIHNAVVTPLPFVDDIFVNRLSAAIENAKSVIGAPAARALHDDMMRVIGKPELEKGNKDL